MTWLLGAVVLLLGGAGAAMLLRRRPRAADRLYLGLLLGGVAAGLVPVLTVLRGGRVAPADLPGSLPGGAWGFGLDPLSGWFLLVILGVGAGAGVFGVGYLQPERPQRSVAGTQGLFMVLLIGLVGVVTARAVVPFLAAWEVMAVSAYFLVMHDREQAEVRRAGLIYLVLTHLSTLALVAMFAALSVHASGHRFDDLGAAGRTPGVVQNVVLGLALVGFGLKAGAVPLHFWLPGAHAAAPSHVSAVLSGVMLKVGIYGLFRILVLVGPPPAWFGWSLFAIGLLSGVLGVVWALAQHELKRLLAYHSVENIGIILLGMGVGVLGVVYGHPAVAVLGLTGALLHTLNHALFKSLLFLGAGTVLRATGRRRIDELGGLARRLPWTALAFGVGSVAIVGLPPFNGFVSEWAVFRGLLAAGVAPDPLRYAVVGTAGLGFIGALALACFTKLDGVLFLGQARRAPRVAALAGDPPPGMLVPMLLLASACLAIGVAPALVLVPARRVLTDLLPTLASAAGVPGEPHEAGLVTQLGLLLLGLTLVLLLARRRVGAARRAPTWGCAGAAGTARMEYTASSYAAPLLTALGPVTGVHLERATAGLRSHASDPVQDGAVLPAWAFLGRTSVRLRGLQGGRLRWYLLSLILTLLALLAYLSNARGPR